MWQRVWQRVFEHLAEDGDNEYAMIDARLIRAYQSSAGANVWLAPSASGLCLTI